MTTHQTSKFDNQRLRIFIQEHPITLSLIFYAGFCFIVNLRPSLNTNNRSSSIKCIEKLLFMITFPFIFLFVKFANIFAVDQEGVAHEEWKSASMAITGVEGTNEAQFQFILQLFIIFNRADREPSMIQMLTLGTSLMSIVNFQYTLA